MEVGRSVGILGVGSWGVALAIHFARKGFDVYLWCFEDDIYIDMKANRTSGPFLTGLLLPNNVYVTQNMAEVFLHANLIFECIPTLYLRAILEPCISFFDINRHCVVSTARGIEADTYCFSTQIVREVLHKQAKELFFSGMNSAEDLAFKRFSTAIISAAPDALNEALYIRKLLETAEFKIEVSADIKGVLVSVAFKNLVTIIMGVLHGTAASENVRFFFLNRCFKEIAQVVRCAGGNIDTVLGIACSYDLWMNYKSVHDMRRFDIGCFIGRGVALEDINKDSYVIPEGLNVLLSIIDYAQSFDIKLPLCNAVKEYLISGYAIDLFERTHNLIALEYEDSAQLGLIR